MARSTSEHEGRSGRRLMGTNLLAQCVADMLRGHWTEVDEMQAEIISVHPPNRRSFNFNRRAIVCKRNPQYQIGTRLNRMITLYPHTCLGQIGCYTFPHTFPTEIIENKPGRYATIGAEHKSGGSRLKRARVRCDSHLFLRSHEMAQQISTAAYAWQPGQASPQIGYPERGGAICR